MCMLSFCHDASVSLTSIPREGAARSKEEGIPNFSRHCETPQGYWQLAAPPAPDKQACFPAAFSRRHVVCLPDVCLSVSDMWHFHVLVILFTYNVYTEGVPIRNAEMVNFHKMSTPLWLAHWWRNRKRDQHRENPLLLTCWITNCISLTLSKDKLSFIYLEAKCNFFCEIFCLYMLVFSYQTDLCMIHRKPTKLSRKVWQQKITSTGIEKGRNIIK